MSTSESSARQADKASIVAAIAVLATALAGYWLTLDASVAGLWPPHLPAQSLDDERVVEYLARALGIVPWPAAAALASAITALVTYWNARVLGATGVFSVAASLAFAFGRGIWSQAILPGIEPLLTLFAALGIACALEWNRSRRTIWIGLAGILVAASAGRPTFHEDASVQMMALWLFLELNAACIALAMAGAIPGPRERRRDVAAIGIVALTLLSLTPFRGASSPHAALLPVLTTIWPFVAVGGSRLAGWLAWPGAAALAAAVVTLVPIAGNYRHVTGDRSRLSRWQLDRVAAQVRPCGVVLAQRRTMPLPEPARVGLREGCDIYALAGARGVLEHAGYRFEPVTMPGSPLGGFIRLVPRGSAVALAVPANGRAVLREQLDGFPLPVGSISGQGGGETGGAYALAAIVGSPNETIENTSRTAKASSDTGRHERWPIIAEADERTSRVAIAGLGAVQSEIGSLLVRSPSGDMLARHELGPDLLVPFDRGAIGLSRLATRLPCATIDASGWTDVTTLAGQGRIGVRSTDGPPAGIILYAARERGLDPWIVTSWGSSAPRMEARSFIRGERPEIDALAAWAARDRLARTALGSLDNVYRIAISGGAPASGVLLTSLDFSGIPAVVLARASDSQRTVSICPAPRGDGYFSEPTVRHEPIGGRRSTFGYGWGPFERQGVRLEQPEGELLISLAGPRAIDVVLSVTPGESGGTISLVVNGVAIDTKPLAAGPGTYRWTTTEAVWKAGVNQAVVESQPGLRVQSIELVATDR
jgi:hypothetical protein